MLKLILPFIVLTSSFLWAAPLDYEALYQNGVQAHNDGKYVQFIDDLLRDENKVIEEIRLELVDIFEKLKKGSDSDREEFFQSLLQHFSDKRQGFKKNALAVDEIVEMSQLIAGKYDSEELTARILAKVAQYETTVTKPLMDEMLAEILRRYSNKYLFFIGRDFAVVHLYAHERSPSFPTQYLTYNVSRAIRDAVIKGKESLLKNLILSSGINQKDLVQRGIALFDSSMSGKIPRSIIFALSDGMSDKEQIEFFSKVSVRYLKSKSSFSKESYSLRDFLKRFVDDKGHVDREALRHSLLESVVKVPMFQVTLPPPVATYDVDHRHNLLEHRYKFLKSGKDLTSEGIISPAPETLWEKAGTLIGLYSELGVRSLGQGRPIQVPYFEKRNLQERLSELDEIFKKQGAAGLKEWERGAIEPGTLSLFQSIQILETAEGKIVRIGDQEFKVIGKLGEGLNLNVYLTTDRKALKVLKRPESARKLLLQQWMQPLLDKYGIPVARIEETHPTGVYQLQEYYPGLSMEAEFSKYADGQKIPKDLNKRIVKIWESAQRLMQEHDLWLDFRSANFQRDSEGRPVFVDLNPRFNLGYWRYFLNSNGGDLLERDAFLETFYNYNLTKPGKVTSRPEECLLLL